MKRLGIIFGIVAVIAVAAFCLLRDDSQQVDKTPVEEPSPVAVQEPRTTTFSNIAPMIDLENDPLLLAYRDIPVADNNNDNRITRFTNGKVIHNPSLTTSRKLNRSQAAKEDINIVHTLLNHYRGLLKENPVGNNREITAQLLGENPHNLVFLFAAQGNISADGELLDRWGSPYRFHALSSKEMEVHSLGPDRKIWTDDDVTFD